MLDSDKAVEHDWGMGAFSDWTKRESQLDEVAYTTLDPGLDRTYIHDAFTQGPLWSLVKCMMTICTVRWRSCQKAMARSGRAKVEKRCS